MASHIGRRKFLATLLGSAAAWPRSVSICEWRLRPHANTCGALADAVGLGLVASAARLGGNVTGISPYVEGLPAKQLELAREIVPGATRIGLLDDPTDPKAHPQRREIEAGVS